ncbi:MAG: peptide chain release factor 1 [Candidatus Omnitrophota bacterium]
MPEQNSNQYLAKFNEIEKRFVDLEGLLLEPEVINDGNLYQKHAKERSEIADIVRKYRRYQETVAEQEKLKKIILDKTEDNEFLQLVNEELAGLDKKLNDLQKQLEDYLIEDDPYANKNVIVEIRAGTGGEEAALFAADLFKMYSRYAAGAGLKLEILHSNLTGLGGLKEIIFSVQGKQAYRRLKYESGIHRVQRVPQTEASGRVHTSAVSVAVLPEAEEIDVQINPKDLKVDVYRSTGPGGQGVNTTDSAVRITHIPTGTVVTCQDERSQLKNKIRAMKILRSRLLDKYRIEQQSKIKDQRRAQIGSGDRSEKIRTYNFSEKRVTDHRINLTLYKLESILLGDITELVETLAEAEREKKLKTFHDSKNE